VKAITVQQPWAWAIVYGYKPVENRTQMVKYRGPLAIHAGARWSQRGAEFEPLQRAYAEWLGFTHWDGPYGGHLILPIDPAEDERDRELFPFGAVIGVVDLVDCHPEAGCCAPWGEHVSDPATAHRLAHHGRIAHLVHLVLEDPRPLGEPVPMQGHQGLWNARFDLILP
jgi:hypothetical protein